MSKINGFLPLLLFQFHEHSCLFMFNYSRKFMVQFYIHEYSGYKTGIIHELFMFMKAGPSPHETKQFSTIPTMIIFAIN